MQEPTKKPLLAYMVNEPHEGHAVICFATNSATARREGAAELGTDWHGIESVRRRPSLDQYAPGPVPPLVLIDDGWWFECSYIDCGRRVSNDTYDDDDEDQEEREPVSIGRSVFCCVAHAAKQLAWRRGRAAAEAALCELIYTRMPAAEIVRLHVYGDRLEPPEYQDGRLVGGIKCLANFKLPGLMYPVTYHFGETHYYVSPIDAERFRELYGAPDPATTSSTA